MQKEDSMNKRHQILAVILVLALTTVACGFLNKQPVVQIKTGSAQKAEIQLPMPASSTEAVDLELRFLAGKLRVAPGATEGLVTGTASFNATELLPRTEVNGSSYMVYQGDPSNKGIPNIEGNILNEWDLQLADRPMNLTINAGPYSGGFELGGLSLQKLTVTELGSDAKVSFSTPNKTDMSAFAYSTGGSNLELKGLANANFENMTFQSGAGTYTLSFDGELQRGATVKVDSGMSTVNIVVPKGVNARVTFDGGLTSVLTDGPWQKSGNTYSLSGTGPAISITVTMGAGTLNLKTQ
jgi:hypothetical protein